MVLSRKNAFQEYALKVLASLNDAGEENSLYQLLIEDDTVFSEASAKDFRSNFICARLALIAQAWETNCKDAGLKETEYSKVFLRKVLDAFQDPKAIQPAVVFSEYFSASQTESETSDSESTALATLIFKRLGQVPTFKSEQGQVEIRLSFMKLVGALESIRTSFENQFFEFLHS